MKLPLMSWKEIPVGAKIVTPGSSIEYKTGSWRTFRPAIDKGKCNKCRLCYVYCPEPAISPEIEKAMSMVREEV